MIHTQSKQVVEEKGPVCYDNDLEGDEDEEQGSDYDDDDMTYPGDPLHLSDPLHFSDYEEGTTYHLASMCTILIIIIFHVRKL